jgi:hypothetical protein
MSPITSAVRGTVTALTCPSPESVSLVERQSRRRLLGGHKRLISGQVPTTSSARMVPLDAIDPKHSSPTRASYAPMFIGIVQRLGAFCRSAIRRLGACPVDERMRHSAICALHRRQQQPTELYRRLDVEAVSAIGEMVNDRPGCMRTN